MSYDSTAQNANPNNTQTPARHDELPAPSGGGFAPMATSGGADYPYADGGDQPQPASIKPRFGMAAAGHVRGQQNAEDGANPFADSVSGSDAARLRGGSAQYAEQGMQAPTHHVHSENDPLPSLPKGDDGGVYAEMDAIPAQETPPVHRVHSESEPLPPPGNNALNQGERPLGVQPVREGGVAVEGREGLPQGKATAVDKVVGKTEKVVGKLTKNWDLHERGELRETGGKAAAKGEARAAHD